MFDDVSAAFALKLKTGASHGVARLCEKKNTKKYRLKIAYKLFQIFINMTFDNLHVTFYL